MTSPLVSVVITSYNTGRYLPETLQSVLAQTHARVEIIVVDDGSTDDTAERIAPYRDRIRFIPRPHEGVAAVRNLGLSLARGDYIVNLDSDDLWTPDALATQLAVAGRNPRSGLIACDGVEFDGPEILSDRLLKGALSRELDRTGNGEISGDFHHQLIQCPTMTCPAQVLIPRQVLAAIGPFAGTNGQDYDYNLRIAQRYPITLHSGSLARWRYRPDSMSGPRERRGAVYEWVALTVLTAHRERCSRADRRVIARRCAELIRNLSYDAYSRALAGERSSGDRDLARLLRARRWPPTALPYRIGLRLPPWLRKTVARGIRMLRR